jgi:hypothetical protein
MQARRSCRHQHGGQHAALALANHERFKLRMDALEQRECGSDRRRRAIAKEPANEYGLALCQADQARSDFAAIANDLEFIRADWRKCQPGGISPGSRLADFLGGPVFAIFVKLMPGRWAGAAPASRQPGTFW